MPTDTVAPNGAKVEGRHPLKHFVFDPKDPKVLYVNMGSASDVCEQGSGASATFPLECPEEDFEPLGPDRLDAQRHLLQAMTESQRQVFMHELAQADAEAGKQRFREQLGKWRPSEPEADSGGVPRESCG